MDGVFCMRRCNPVYSFYRGKVDLALLDDLLVKRISFDPFYTKCNQIVISMIQAWGRTGKS